MGRLSLSSGWNTLLVVVCLCWLPRCKTQVYELIVNRDFFNGIQLDSNSNKVRLNCRDSDSQDHPDYPFWINDTQQGLRERLGPGNFIENTNGLIFMITRELEGLYFCGPNQNNVSLTRSLVAYPLPNEHVRPRMIPVVAGEDAVLPPLIQPGALLEQYFIDWINGTSSQTLARIQGPRTQQSPFEPDERYSVDPDTFALTIRSVTFEDRGSYLGVVGVRDPGGQSFTYLQTQANELTLEVSVNPSFIESPRDRVVNSTETTFTCTVEAYPAPTIRWYHNDQVVTATNKYRILPLTIQDSPFVVESTLTIMNLVSDDSGKITCVAMVMTNEELPFVEKMNRSCAQLSVLRELRDFNTIVTLTQGVILRVELFREMAVEVQLFVQYTDAETGRKFSRTTSRYNTAPLEINVFDTEVPFSRFTVDVALMSGSLMGPLRRDPKTHELSMPSELGTIITMYALPYCFAFLVVLAIVVMVTVVVSVCLCRNVCCVTCNPSKAVIIEKSPFNSNRVKDLIQQRAALEQQLVEKEQQLVEKDRQLVEKDRQLVEKDRRLVEIEQQLVEKEQQLVMPRVRMYTESIVTTRRDEYTRTNQLAYYSGDADSLVAGGPPPIDNDLACYSGNGESLVAEGPPPIYHDLACYSGDGESFAAGESPPIILELKQLSNHKSNSDDQLQRPTSRSNSDKSSSDDQPQRSTPPYRTLSSFLRIICCETKKERKAREDIEETERLLQKLDHPQ